LFLNALAYCNVNPLLSLLARHFSFKKKRCQSSKIAWPFSCDVVFIDGIFDRCNNRLLQNTLR